ncbi:MAG TPA: sulfotransferase [Porticoccaceae bacterium]|nr:sulfotransferase [Porticoccaceae bacterium]
MTQPLKSPELTRIYQNHHIDSTRWQLLKPRPDDVIIATTQKSGTTWVQKIVSLLIFQNQKPPAPFHDISVYVDMRLSEREELANTLEAQHHRRFLKTHLALDGFPFHPELKHIFVSRDGRDIAMSLWNNYHNYSPQFLDLLANYPGRVGDSFPPAGDDIHEFLDNWLSRGWFDWEGDGYPYWSNLHCVKTWWEYRHLPNILFVHYSDLLMDRKAQIERIADFLDIDVTPEYLEKASEEASFDAMKKKGDEDIPMAKVFFEGGSDIFIHKGTNGRWKDVMTPAQLAQYNKRVKEQLSPECARWLAQGGTIE